MNNVKTKKPGFLTFLFSLIPGAAEMYMGFMKMGISLLALFLAICAISSIFSTLGILAVLVWFYAFFHARKLVHLSDDDFEKVNDHYIWEEFDDLTGLKTGSSSNKVLAWILIVLGIAIIWENVSDYLYLLIPNSQWNTLAPFVRSIPQVAIAVLIIVVGVKLIKGKKKELTKEDGKKNS